MKRNIILLPVLIVFALLLSSCDSKLGNTLTIRNLSAGKLLINFRASIYEVPIGESFTIKDIQRGTFTFTTTYGVPSGTESSSVEGDASGSLVFKQNTRILILYSSTFFDGNYTLFATLTSSDDLTTSDPTAP